MSTFKERFEAAVTAVFEKLNAMSKEELNTAIEEHGADERTGALYYALSIDNYDKTPPEKFAMEWKNLENFAPAQLKTCSKQCPRFSFYQATYEGYSASDDYFYEVAA